MVITTPEEDVERVRELNDELRTTCKGGQILVTRGVEQTSYMHEILEAVRNYDFSPADPGNDPYGERDFGVMELYGEKYYWKIDYYDLDMRYHSPDKADPRVTRRVLTVMRADEY